LRNIVKNNDDLWLREKCYQSTGPYLRPFAPNANWQKARVFIIGLNPSTPFREEFDSFDHYWQSLTHYPTQYQKVYRAKYQKAEVERSRTSRRISEFLSYLEPLNVLVTNVFAYPTPNPLLIPRRIKREPFNERILCRLIKICEPKVLFFHGREARRFAEKYFAVTLNPYALPKAQGVKVKISNSSLGSWVFSYHHFVGRVDTKDVVSERVRQFAECIHQRFET
jgi:hypothetical protein